MELMVEVRAEPKSQVEVIVVPLELSDTLAQTRTDDYTLVR